MIPSVKPRAIKTIHCIEDAKYKLLQRNLTPKCLHLSQEAHDELVKHLELEKKKFVRLFEFLGLKISIDENCPAWTGYLEGEE